MLRKIIILSVVLAVVCAQGENTECGPNKEWNSCGSACPPTCGLSDMRPCTLQCVIGCACKPGLMVKGDECVEPKDC